MGLRVIVENGLRQFRNGDWVTCIPADAPAFQWDGCPGDGVAGRAAALAHLTKYAVAGPLIGRTDGTVTIRAADGRALTFPIGDVLAIMRKGDGPCG